MNNHKISVLFAFTFIISILSPSCSLYDDERLIIGRWEVRRLITKEGDILSDPPDSYIFKFDEEGFWGFNSDVNSCASDYLLGMSGSFDMERVVWCTQVCCDSDYAEKMMSLASHTNSFKVTRYSLTLSGGEGEIKLRRTRY